MKNNTKILSDVQKVLRGMPTEWLSKTTHRLDIYNEKLAKFQFLDQFEELLSQEELTASDLSDLPTAFDYIRLGHPLSCLLEWTVAKLNNLEPENVISFSSKVMPILAILRKNLLENIKTQIFYQGELPNFFDTEILQSIYGYKFNVSCVESAEAVSDFDGCTIFVSQEGDFFGPIQDLSSNIDFFVNTHPDFGSLVFVNGSKNKDYLSEIQHVRRRETVAMTPHHCLAALKTFAEDCSLKSDKKDEKSQLKQKELVYDSIKKITNGHSNPLLGSSGLSVQYAIVMGLIDDALENCGGKKIKVIVPPNCYGGTNDQARRVAACIDQVEVVDLPVDDGKDMVTSLEQVLTKIAQEDGVPFIIAEIPTNPRVEVPDLIQLKKALSKSRKTKSGESAVEPVFILDQTFCPNVNFLGEDDILSTVQTISYVSGSKFPSGGLCTAGYCVSNKKMRSGVMAKIEKHFKLCDNEATDFQIETLSKQLPSMNQRIDDAYKNTRKFVNFIKEVLPGAKVNFVSEDLANKGFRPSVFSLDLPTKGGSYEEKENFKRQLNHRLINLMIEKIPDESQYCVSYGQLKGCYWTIPATSTQGTTKEGDKDYIVRVAVAPIMNVELHKKVFRDFVETL